MAKVLIVNNAAETIAFLRDALDSRGYQVCVAQSGQEALERARRERPDAVLLDVLLPDIDGIEVCRRLKGDDELRTAAVILVSSKGPEESLIAAWDAGADDYLTYPLDRQVLAARLRAALRVKQFHDTIGRMNEHLREEIVGRKRAEEKVHTIAHELDNLLQGISGYANCALEGLTPQEQRYRDLQQVLQAADRAATLTRQLPWASRDSLGEPGA